MRAVTVTRPGAFIGCGPVRVYEGGTLFYSFDRARPFRFTLPVGRYTMTNAEPAGDYIHDPATGFDDTPPGMKMPANIRVIFAKNPNKCSIDLKRGVIICDPAFRALPRVCLTYILFHEIGHYWNHGANTPEEHHRQEVACDAFAAREMLARGWNPSQIAAASDMTLSACSHRRKAEQWNTMRNTVRNV